jgi:hypothetical protein
LALCKSEKDEKMLPNPKLFTLCYFAPASWYALAISDGPNYLEREDNFQKQSYRNRCVIYSPNGPMPLVVPIVHDKNAKQRFRDIQIDDRQKWRQTHRKSIENAYRNSPYFPYFEDDLKALYETSDNRLYSFDLHCHQWVEKILRKKIDFTPTPEWTSDFEGMDLRDIIHPKKKSILEKPHEYRQTFDHKLGFLPDLSILDVVFNLGLETVSYLSNNTPRLKL